MTDTELAAAIGLHTAANTAAALERANRPARLQTEREARAAQLTRKAETARRDGDHAYAAELEDAAAVALYGLTGDDQ